MNTKQWDKDIIRHRTVSELLKEKEKMTETTELSIIRGKLDILVDDIRISMGDIIKSMSDIDEYTDEISKLLIESGERL